MNDPAPYPVLTQEMADRSREQFESWRTEVAREIVGHDEVVGNVLRAMVMGGHVLLEGVPGLGKTLLVAALSRTLGVEFSRIQFTPDLMPADILGTNVVVEDPETGRRRFEFHPGPIFSHLVLADEINRATPRTQSALLEAMAEQSVTVAGEVRSLEDPFLVLATQNPIELEGTYPLPEAQLDRFLFKLEVRFPVESALVEILERTTGPAIERAGCALSREDLLSMRALARQVPVARHVMEYAARLIGGTHPVENGPVEACRRYVRHGASPRGAQAIVGAAKVAALTSGRLNAAFEDVREACGPALNHRLILNYEAQSDGVTARDILERLVEAIPLPSAQIS